MKDRTLKLSLALIAVALWAIVLRPLWMPSTAQAQADRTSTATYQYWIAVDDDLDKLEASMNAWGKEGWRAAGFAVLPLNGFRPSQTVILMEKRTD